MSKNQAQIDPRVKRTRQLLRTALIELIPEKGYNAITIQDITERATLNRATFYLHFRDKDDLLLNGFMEIWDELTSQSSLLGLKESALEVDSMRLSVLADFQHLADHAAFYRVMLGENGVAAFIHRMQDHICNTTVQRFLSALDNPPVSTVPIELLLHFIATSYVGVMQWWLAQDMPYSPEEMASVLVTLYTTSPFQAMGITVR